MKNTYRHLLIYPTVLLTCLSLSAGVAIRANAQASSNAQQPAGRSRPTETPRTSSASSSPSSTVSTNSPGESPASNGSTDKPASTPAISSEQKDSTSFTTFLPWISGLLHLLEFAGLGGLLYLLNRAKKISATREQKFGEKLVSLDKSWKDHDGRIQSLESNLSTVKKQAAQIQGGLERSLSQQQARDLPSPQGFPIAGVTQREYGSVAPVVSEYPFLDLYKQSSDSFKNQYNPTVVSESEENLQKRWGGDQHEIILGTDRRGNYWLFSEGNKIYLIPNPKLNIIDANMRTVGSIFECINYSHNYRGFSIVKPAIVSLHMSSTEQQWKLEKKGTLEFS